MLFNVHSEYSVKLKIQNMIEIKIQNIIDAC